MPLLPGEVYFSAAAVLPDDVEVSGFGPTFTTKGVNIPMNTSKDVTIQLYSDGPMSEPWNVQVYDFSTAFGCSPSLNISLGTSTGNNGDTITATITPTAQGPFGPGVDAFFVVSTQGNVSHFTLGLVGEPAN